MTSLRFEAVWRGTVGLALGAAPAAWLYGAFALPLAASDAVPMNSDPRPGTATLSADTPAVSGTVRGTATAGSTPASAADRWERLKAREQAAARAAGVVKRGAQYDGTSSTALPLPTETVVRPTLEPIEAPPLPDAADEPAWILASPAVIEVQRAEPEVASPARPGGLANASSAARGSLRERGDLAAGAKSPSYLSVGAEAWRTIDDEPSNSAGIAASATAGLAPAMRPQPVAPTAAAEASPAARTTAIAPAPAVPIPVTAGPSTATTTGATSVPTATASATASRTLTSPNSAGVSAGLPTVETSSPGNEVGVEGNRFLPPTPATIATVDESATLAHSSTPAPGVTGLPPMPPLPGETVVTAERRRLRSIAEIRPFYDTTVDKDIRQFAEQRAADYGVRFGGDTAFTPRQFPDMVCAWEASNFYHYPLYFEDAVLERYGHTYHPLVQPFVSVGKFTGQLIAFPYQATLDPICKPMYALGWYRPGDCAPKLRYQVPLNAQAAVVEAGVVTGLFFLIP